MKRLTVPAQLHEGIEQGVETKFHSFLTPVIVRGVGQHQMPGALPPGKNPEPFELYATAILNKFIQIVHGVPTEWSPASSKPNTMIGSL